MTGFVLHTAENAPEASKHRLARSHRQLGFVPNLFAVQAEAPALLEGFQTLSAIFARSSLTPIEREVVLLTASYENECSYCIAHHSAIAEQRNAPEELVLALREGQPLPDPKLEALRDFTRAVVRGRGRVGKPKIRVLRTVGYGRQQILEVILGVALMVMSNYTNRFAQTPLEDALSAFAWVRARPGRLPSGGSAPSARKLGEREPNRS
jgi:uncharacterized peroxidase-related enzyme